MGYPRQPSVTAKLHARTHAALDTLRNRHKIALAKLWQSARQEMQGSILAAYKRAAPAGRWTLPAFVGQRDGLRRQIQGAMIRFHALSSGQIRQGLQEMRTQSILRHAWILDQLTPPNVKVMIPAHQGQREAGIVRQISAADWNDRWTHWVDSYMGSLMSNLQMEAINESTLSDAVDEVDATKVNTPASALENALARLWEYQAQREIAKGEGDVADMNEDLVDVEVWKTRGDMRVCDVCDANEGLTVAEADTDIPAHPNCHCFWLMVPESYAELLRSGDAGDQDLARAMQARGIAPEALVIRNQAGDITAKVIVDFQSWVEGMPIPGAVGGSR